MADDFVEIYADKVERALTSGDRPEGLVRLVDNQGQRFQLALSQTAQNELLQVLPVLRSAISRLQEESGFEPIDIEQAWTAERVEVKYNQLSSELVLRLISKEGAGFSFVVPPDELLKAHESIGRALEWQREDADRKPS